MDFLRECKEHAHSVQRLKFSPRDIIEVVEIFDRFLLDFFIQSAKLVTEIVVSLSEPQTTLSNTPLHINTLRDALNTTREITARFDAENDGMNTDYRIVLKAIQTSSST